MKRRLVLQGKSPEDAQVFARSVREDVRRLGLDVAVSVGLGATVTLIGTEEDFEKVLNLVHKVPRN